MSFTGDLEHLPIVDVIQLMNSSRKSGILSVKGKKGESQLVFKDGYIVSASHLDNSIRIGQILVDMGLITSDQLQAGLARQQADGSARKPLVITLIEMGLTKEEHAHKGLQKLIETTLVEILTWKTGKFTLQALSETIACDFRYYPEKMNHEINMNTQSILMDALRIFDEKMRDGLIQEDKDEDAAFDDAFSELLSEDLLGLSEIDHLAAQLPKAFTGVAPSDPVETHRSRVGELAPNLPSGDLDLIADFLEQKDRNTHGHPASQEQERQIILLSSDVLLGHCLETLLHGTPVGVIRLESVAEVESSMARSIEIGLQCCLIIDATTISDANRQRPLDLCARVRDRFPQSIRLLLARSQESTLALQAYGCGARAVIPVPSAAVDGTAFARMFIGLLEILPAYLLAC